MGSFKGGIGCSSLRITSMTTHFGGRQKIMSSFLGNEEETIVRLPILRWRTNIGNYRQLIGLDLNLGLSNDRSHCPDPICFEKTENILNYNTKLVSNEVRKSG